MNNRAVTLVELLIAIVVMGIIAAFSIVSVNEIISNTKESAFVVNADQLIESARNAYYQAESLWDDDVATLQELVDFGYIEISTNDPWSGTYDLNGSYVEAVDVVVFTNTFYLSVYANSFSSDVIFRVKLVSTTAVIGYDAALEEFTTSDIVFLNGEESIIDRIVQMFNNDLTNNLTTDDNPDEITVDGSIKSSTTVSTLGGDDIVNVDGSVTNKSTLNTGDGDDTVVIDKNISTNSTVNTGAGDDNVTVNAKILGSSKLYTKEGDDIVTVNGNFLRATIDTGDGNDTITLNNIGYKGIVKTGSGDDNLTINSVAYTYNNGSVNMGDGDDILTINDTLTGAKSKYYGGEGTDTLYLPRITVAQWNSSKSKLFSGFETVVLSNGTVNP